MDSRLASGAWRVEEVVISRVLGDEHVTMAAGGWAMPRLGQGGEYVWD